MTTEAELIECEGHGKQPAAIVCEHLAESQPDAKSIGFHWSCDSEGLAANCDECEAEAGDDGFLPDDYVLENFVMICRLCFVEMAEANGVAVAEIDSAEAATKTATAN